ncbi:hypothetical protein SASPL_116104 [Salvia splendens]|uniref:Reticulon-like protein n=1 Tax=Salvia splendens TaxID=180675 RepID=A0A8X8Y696_SALSN|nr:hypothetical protein SASPL_116104 [Salvia splendens]
MADHAVEHENHESESLIENVTEKLHGSDSSSSDADGDDGIKSAASAVKSKITAYSAAKSPLTKSRPRIPEVGIPEDIVRDIASAFRSEINFTLATLREIASGKDVKSFLAVNAGLWVLSVLGSCLNFLTLFYIGFVVLHSVPLLYEKYEDQVDAFAEKAEAELEKQYAVFHSQVLSEIPRGPLKDKKFL